MYHCLNNIAFNKTTILLYYVIEKIHISHHLNWTREISLLPCNCNFANKNSLIYDRISSYLNLWALVVSRLIQIIYNIFGAKRFSFSIVDIVANFFVYDLTENRISRIITDKMQQFIINQFFKLQKKILTDNNYFYKRDFRRVKNHFL